MDGEPRNNCPNCLSPMPSNAQSCPSCGFPFTALAERVPLPAGVLLVTFFQIIGSLLYLLFSYLSGSVVFVFLDIMLLLVGIAFFMGYSIARFAMFLIFPVVIYFLTADALIFLALYRSPPASVTYFAPFIISIVSFIYLLTPSVGLYFEQAAKRRKHRYYGTKG